MGKIDAICVGARKGMKKTAVSRARLIENHGLEGDAHAGPGHRQVSLLGRDDWEETRRRGLPDLKFGDFAENLLVSGIALETLGLGSRLRLGERAELSVTQRGKTCHSRCSIYEQTGDCIMPRCGLFARVTRGGEIHAGDPIELLETVSRARAQLVVLTISDRGSTGQATDTAGPAVARMLVESLDAHLYRREILPDDLEQVTERLRHYADGHNIDLVVTVGGTGFSLRDTTPEAVRGVADRLTPGLDEAMRRASLESTPRAMLSRAVSGIRGQTLILSLPGSERAALENLRAVLPALPHGLAGLSGEVTDCGRTESEPACMRKPTD